MDLLIRISIIFIYLLGLIKHEALYLVAASDLLSTVETFPHPINEVTVSPIPNPVQNTVNELNENIFTFINQDAFPSTDALSGCTIFIEKFSDAAANFTRCSILNSRPLKFCEHCVEEYTRAYQLYNKIIMGKAFDESGNVCSKSILNADRIQIVVNVASFIKSLWDKCDCEACYDMKIINGTLEYKMKNDTEVIFHLFNQTLECFHTYGNFSGSIEPFIKPTNISINNTAVCHHCSDIYKHLNEFYSELEEKDSKGVCMDIIDVMNATRKMWSKTFACRHPRVDPLPVVLLATFFCLLPIIFYTANKIHGTKMEKKLLKQKRMREEDGSISTSNSFIASTPTTNTT